MAEFIRRFTMTGSMRAVLGIGSGAMLLVALLLLNYRAIPMENRDAFMVLVGVVASNVRDAFGFFFGSSAGSVRKSESIEKMMVNGEGEGN